MKPVLQIRELITLNKHAWYMVYRPKVTIYICIFKSIKLSISTLWWLAKIKYYVDLESLYERRNKSNCYEKRIDSKSIPLFFFNWLRMKKFMNFLLLIIIDHASVSNVFCVDISRLNFISDNHNQCVKNVLSSFWDLLVFESGGNGCIKQYFSL